MISVIDLTKKYGDFTAVADLNFHVRPGEIFGLLGTNGAGKSTTIQILTGQLLPTSGKISVLGLDPVTERKKIHCQIGFIPDQQSLYEDLSVYDNIDFFRKIHGLKRAATDQMIEKLDLTEKTKQKVKNLSKGLRQRVLIGRSLLHKPKVLFLDEPTSGLDPSSANTICMFLEELKKSGTTILLTTHLMNEVDRLCDRVVFINKGRKIDEGTPFELKLKYRRQSVSWVVRNDTGFFTEEKDIASPGLFSDMQSLYSKDELVHFEMHLPTLEDVFIKIVEERP